MARHRPTPDELDAQRVWERLPDGDTVLAPGQRRWADLLSEHTEMMPVLDEPPVRPYLLRLFRRGQRGQR
jgi:hypothetical protein